MKFGDNLKYLRKVNNLSQEKLAEKLGVSRQSVSKWECGDAYPEMKHIIVLCDLFHCKINDLVHSNLSDIYELDEEIQQSVVKFKKDKQDKMQLFSKLVYMFARFWKFCSIGSLLLLIVIMFIVPGLVLSNTQDFIQSITTEYSWMANMNSTTLLIVLEFIFVFGIITCVLHWNLSKHLQKLSLNFYIEKSPFVYENVEHVKKTILYLICIIVFSVISETLLSSLEASKFIFSGTIIHLVVIVVSYLVIYIFEYGYEIQKDSTGVMYGDLDETEKKNAIAFLNQNIMQYTKKFSVIGIVGLLLFFGYSFSKIQFDFLSNLPTEIEQEVEIILSLEELGFVESDVNDAHVQKNSDGSYWYSLSLDNSSSLVTPSKQHFNMYLDIYKYETDGVAKHAFNSMMVDDKRNQMYTDNYVKGLARDTYYYIKLQNITEYMLEMNHEEWNADMAYMLYDENNYSENYFNPGNRLYILKDNKVMIIELNNAFYLTSDQVEVCKTLFDRVDVVFDSLDTLITE